jgi:hypothetical protein
MADYKKMYHKLFNAVTSAIEILQNAQLDTEEVYMDSPTTVLTMLETAQNEATGEEQKVSDRKPADEGSEASGIKP